MKKESAIIFICLSLLNCQLLMAQDFSYKPEYSAILDASKGMELMNQCTRCTPPNGKIFWNVSKEDIDKLENNFKKILELKSSSCSPPNTSIKTLDGYLFQYIGVYIGSTKFIYVNAFHGKD